MDEQLLFDRFHAALDAEPRAGAYERLRAALVASKPPVRRSRWLRLVFPFEVSRPLRTVVAAVVILALALAAIGGFVAIRQYVHQQVPVIHPRVPAAGTCAYGFHMIDETTGWEGTSRSTDGGNTWKDPVVPPVPNATKGGAGSCTLGGLHAWMTVAVATAAATANKNAPPQADHLLVLISVDGGQTWAQGGTVPASGFNAGAVFGFINDQVGWLLVDGDTRTVYGTTDGGYHWSRVSAPGTLDKFVGPCTDTGMTFATPERGWITWDCTGGRGSGVSGDNTSVVAATVDGGRTWAFPALPPYAPRGQTCSAAPPVFTGSRGVMPITCPGSGPASWSGIYRTADLGTTWTLGSSPPQLYFLAQVDFVDAALGFAFTGAAEDLYRTVDSGQSWTLVKKSVFAGQQIDRFQFLSGTTGFAYTTTSQGRPWKTTDGGLTWSLGGARTLPGNVGCPAPWAPNAGEAPVPVLLKDRSTGWAAGSLRTADGGLHWTPSGPPAPPLPSSGRVEFYLDNLHAWVATSAGSATACADHVVVQATADGGATWRTMGTLPVVIGSPGDQVWGRGYSASPRGIVGWNNGPYLYFADPSHGWMIVTVGRPNFFMGARSVTLYRTDDGGATWTELSRPATQDCGTDQLGVVFSNATVGWMSAYACSGNDPAAVYVTSDAGDSWTLRTVGPPCGCSGAVPLFFNSLDGLLMEVQPGSVLLATSDGGNTWSSRTLPPDVDLYGPASVSWTNPSHGWMLFAEMASPGGKTTFPLYRSADGGRSWSLLSATSIPSADSYSQASLYFVDANVGFIAVGPRLYRTGDGGRSWSLILTVSS